MEYEISAGRADSQQFAGATAGAALDEHPHPGAPAAFAASSLAQQAPLFVLAAPPQQPFAAADERVSPVAGTRR